MEKYINALIEALHPFGEVLEVGFGPSSQLIQKYHPESHTIVTMDPDAIEWSKKHPTVKILRDVWQGALPNLGVFDTIYFGIDPHENPLLEKLTKIKYTDTELETFCHSIQGADKKQIARFLSELEQHGQITPEQKEKMIRKYKLEHLKPPKQPRSDELYLFAKQCVDLHMRKGSRLSCYLRDNVTPAENPNFFNDIVVNPNLDYREDGRIVIIEKLTG